MIVGFGDYREELERIAPPGTLFTGPLEHRHLVHLIPLCDVTVVPSIFPEAFGMVAAEAAAGGSLPLVARHSGPRGDRRGPRRAARSRLRDRRRGRPRAEARALLELPPDERRRLAGAARRTVVEQVVVAARRRAAAQLIRPSTAAVASFMRSSCGPVSSSHGLPVERT